MKNQILLLAAFFICTATFAQKDELKAAEKAIKKGDYVTSAAEITKAEALISGADDKTKSKFYYLKGETYAAMAKTDPSEANYAAAAESFNALFSVEKTLGSDKYSVLAEPTLNTMVSEVSAKGIESYQNKNYSAAKTELFQVYN